jgi:very-short-patch-repair endonuclease
MLENAQPPKAEEHAKQGLIDAEDNPWMRNSTVSVLQSLVHSFDSKGEYHDRLNAEVPRSAEKPIVEYAPALILRKRSVRGLTQTLQMLKEQLIAGEKIPEEFKDLAEIQGTSVINSGDRSNSNYDNRLTYVDEVYFAKPYNKEQRQIIEKLNQSNGVLVQGPPGTGKSHTIANLICHLLANGKRILVTAKTPRALQVIERQLPSEIQPLCVNLLGSGAEERRSLENSMSAILQKTQHWHDEESQQLITDLEENLNKLREEKVSIERRIRVIRESETYYQVIADGSYKGTAAQIVNFVQNDRFKYDWLSDDIPTDKPCPVDNEEMTNLLHSLRFLTDEKRQELQLYLPETLPKSDELSELFLTEKKLISEEDELKNGVDTTFLEKLIQQKDFSIDSLLQPLTLLLTHLRKLRTLPNEWVEGALKDIAAGQEAAWKELCSVTEKSLTLIADFVKNADEIQVNYLDRLDLKSLRRDAEKLYEFLHKGGKIRWGPFCPSNIRPLLYITKKVLVNGKKCASVEEINSLIKLLRVQHEVESLWNFWSGIVTSSGGPYIIQYMQIKTNFEILKEVLATRKMILSCQKLISDWYNEYSIVWYSDKQINALVQSCKLALVQGVKNDIVKKIKTLAEPIQIATQRQNAHFLVLELWDAINNRSIKDFLEVERKLQDLNKQKERMLKADSVIKKINSVASQTAKEILETYSDTRWDQQMPVFQDAWNWARARSWINNYIEKDDVASLGERLLQVDREIEHIISRLAAQKAWSFCFSRMSELHRRHMEAWQQHVVKLGKGTGKYAPFHRREAQANLDKCRDAVPAWVMPLHRVWDTISPSAGMFDVIVVDEASQCGLEALPLFYMGKKILVVGDDKQISPDAVGVPQDTVHRLMDEYLADFKFKTSFDVTSSLFDQAKLRYSTRKIVLREHFRCMPEIIRFSNDLCYSGEPLIPLRQYGPERLKPLQKVFIENGYREGAGSRVINRPEAEAIAKKIVELCKDPRYDNMTMGVVILQGEAQAVLIETLLLKTLGAEEMEHRRIICGNPYSFQGDERNVILISMVAAPNERIGTLNKSADERRFNVAASRAKDQMWLFHSVTSNDLSKSCLRLRLLEFFEQTKIDPIVGVDSDELERIVFNANRSIVNAPKPFDSWFEVDVALELARKKYHVIPQFEVAGKYIDLVIEGNGSRLAVECDGDAFHGIDNFEQDMERQKILERCGWPFFRIRESEFYANKTSVMERLFTVLESRGIHPIGKGNHSYKRDPVSKVTQMEDNDLIELPHHNPLHGDNVTQVVTNNPSDIHEAMQMEYPTLRDAIIATLKLRPNHSCVKEAVVKYLLKYLEIITRGKPRKAFAFKVNKVLDKMAKAKIIKIYTAKNERVKLEPEPYLSIALQKDIYT